MYYYFSFLHMFKEIIDIFVCLKITFNIAFSQRLLMQNLSNFAVL